MKVVFDLTSQNKFNAIYVNVSAPDRAMHLPSQRNFIKNITEWNEVKPVLYHGHFPYLNFAQHGSNLNPVYINLIRDPLERMASFYYFMRYGDNKRPHLIRKRMGDKTVSICIASFEYTRYLTNNGSLHLSATEHISRTKWQQWRNKILYMYFSTRNGACGLFCKYCPVFTTNYQSQYEYFYVLLCSRFLPPC